jgi:hypothetical protein
MVEENRSVGNTKIGNSDTPQMIQAGIPPPPAMGSRIRPVNLRSYLCNGEAFC